MSQLFDIFRTEPDGNVVWQGTAATTKEAATLVQRLSANSPGDYLVLNLENGTMRLIKRHPSDAQRRQSNFGPA